MGESSRSGIANCGGKNPGLFGFPPGVEFISQRAGDCVVGQQYGVKLLDVIDARRNRERTKQQRADAAAAGLLAIGRAILNRVRNTGWQHEIDNLLCRGGGQTNTQP